MGAVFPRLELKKNFAKYTKKHACNNLGYAEPMNEPQRVTVWPTERRTSEDIAVWMLVCPDCGFIWHESTHDLWNVCSLECPGCGRLLGVPEQAFHGDVNAQDQDE